MPLPTVVDEYIHAAINLASIEHLDGVFSATVPDAFGIVAFGATRQDCAKDLQARLEDWVTASLSNGEPLPVFGGIDFSGPDALALSAYHPPSPSATGGTAFKDEYEFFAALSQWERES